MPKPSPTEYATGELLKLSEAAHVARLKKAKGLIEEVLAGEEKEAAKPDELGDDEMGELEGALGD